MALTKSKYKKSVLSNGVRVITEDHSDARGVSCGFWITTGTRFEDKKVQGVSHFIEHLVFKRTKNRTAYEIARDMEAVGGDLNAFTSRESTCFHTHSLKEDLELSIDILTDLVGRAQFDAVDFEKEKQVVLQEIHMSADQLEDAVFDVYFQKAYGGHPLGWPILGTAKSIQSMKRAYVEKYYREKYTPENLIVSVAGRVDHDQLVRILEKKLSFAGEHRKSTPSKLAVSHKKTMRGLKSIEPSFLDRESYVEPKSFHDIIKKPNEQVHILMGLPAAGFKDKLRFDGFIVNSLLGGGMTSRLYQTIREEQGLAYAIYSHLSTFTDSGLMLIYAGTEPKNVKKVIETAQREVERIRKEGMSKADLDLYKTQVKGQILLGADDIENRMNSLGVNEMVFGEYRSVDDIIDEIDRVNLETVHAYIEKFVRPDDSGLLLMGAMELKPKTKAKSKAAKKQIVKKKSKH